MPTVLVLPANYLCNGAKPKVPPCELCQSIGAAWIKSQAHPEAQGQPVPGDTLGASGTTLPPSTAPDWQSALRSAVDHTANTIKYFAII